MKTTHKIVMLPTEKADSKMMSNMIMKYKSKLYLYHDSKYEYDKALPFYLYILSDEEIKEGDWYVWLGNKQICQAIGYRETDMDGLNAHVKANDVVKIIATTDKSLKMINAGKDIPLHKVSINYVPQIPESFLPIFVKAYNEANIGGVSTTSLEVELECKGTMDWGIKTTESNEVIISLPKAKMYSREEVKSLMRDAMVQMSDWKNKGHTTKSLNPLMDKWIEENL